MLALARRAGQKIRIGDDVVVVVHEVRGKQVRLAIEAPGTVKVWREEIYESIVQANLQGVRLPKVPDAVKALEPDSLLGTDNISCPRFGQQPGLKLTLCSSIPGIAREGAAWIQDPHSPAVWWLIPEESPELALPTVAVRAIPSMPVEPPRPSELALLEDSQALLRFCFSENEQGVVLINRFAPIYWSAKTYKAAMVCAMGSGLGTEEPWTP